MMHSYALAIGLQSGGSILRVGTKTMGKTGLPPLRIFTVGSEAIRTQPMNCKVQYSRSGWGFHNDASGHFIKIGKLP